MSETTDEENWIFFIRTDLVVIPDGRMEGDEPVEDAAGRRDSEEWGRCHCGVASTRKRPDSEQGQNFLLSTFLS